MAKFAFHVKAVSGVAEIHLGFQWGPGGIGHTAVFATSQLTFAGGVGMETANPVEIPGGFPGLHGRRIFLDIMGSSLTSAFLDVDFKIYAVDGTVPIYQTPTLSIPVIGFCTNGFTINTTVERGGVVGDNWLRRAYADRLGLLDTNGNGAVRRAEPDEQFCGYSQGARLRAILGQCP
jgi:hypothetical protein